MEAWLNEIMFILQYFEDYKCWWDSKPSITAVNIDPEKLSSDSSQQILINFFVVVQACFWTCSPLALGASRAVTGVLCSTNPSSLLQCWLHSTVPIPLQSSVKLSSLRFYLQTRKLFLLTALRRPMGPAKKSVISTPGLFYNNMTSSRQH